MKRRRSAIRWRASLESRSEGRTSRPIENAEVPLSQPPDGPRRAPLYEHLVTRELEVEITRARAALAEPMISELERAEVPDRLARHLARELARELAAMRGSSSREEQVALCNELVALARSRARGEGLEGAEVVPPPRLLEAIHHDSVRPRRPTTRLSHGALLTASADDPRLGAEILAELESAEAVDAIVSFVKTRGWQKLREGLEAFSNRGGRFRLLSTTYLGASDAEALIGIARLPGAEVRISHDVRRTRLHAKAWHFRRSNGLGTAYVGSANVSATALSEGLEWTLKASEAETPAILAKFGAAFEALWCEGEFERFDPSQESDVTRLKEALRAARGSSFADAPVTLFDLRPHPFQQEILDRLDSERRLGGKTRHLVVAATGTGKTMIAAFDYRRLAAQRGARPRLLFVAHRDEILDQALASYRGVLRDPSFGERLGGGREPESFDHLFANMQTIASRDLVARMGAGYWTTIVVDEAHHAAAASYDRFLDVIAPEILLGLTATPERTDGKPLLHWFGGEPSAEIRLWDAIDRGLVVPFDYFGIHDDVALTDVAWTRGRYDTDGLDRLYSANDRRAELVLSELARLHGNPRDARVLGFCVSVAHARFMARKFTEAGLPSLAVFGDSPAEKRRSAPARLRSRDVCALFTCDLYNEGVDIPEIDTLLLLRPTESALLFQQQLGRGLRFAEGKACALVLDFIGQSRREFRFDRLLTVLTGLARGLQEEEVERGFPFLPSGCAIQLDRMSRQIVLENLRQAARTGGRALVADLVELRALSGGEPITLARFLRECDRSLEEVYRSGRCWTSIRREGGLLPPAALQGEAELGARFGALLHVDEPVRLDLWAHAIETDAPVDGGSGDERRMLMLGARLDDRTLEILASIRGNSDLREEFLELMALLRRRVGSVSPVSELPGGWSLEVHRHYTRDEVLVAVGATTAAHEGQSREGVFRVKDVNAELLFVNIEKHEKFFSESTRYLDYAMGPERFHWQTQSTVRESSPTHVQYSGADGSGRRFFLFVRERPKDDRGRTMPFLFLGEVRYESSSGSRPVNVVWRLEHAIPAALVPRFTPLHAA
jgi:superfamily II DNA or RNA helicase/HKD family nuclease